MATDLKSLLPLASDIGERLKTRGETVGISESSSGGLISTALLAVPGASAFYRGGGVIYTPKAFGNLLGLSREDVAGTRSSTEPYARLLAQTIRQRLNASWGVCETGASGPTGNGYGDAAGHTCIAISGANGSLISHTLETGLDDRFENMHLFAQTALEALREALT